MASKTGRSGKSNRSGKGSKRSEGKAGGVAKGIKDFIDDFENHEGKMPGTETLIPLPFGWGEIVISEDTGPVDPWDCRRWPQSIFCEGDFRPNPADTGVSIEGISASECELMIEVGYSLVGFSMPTGLIGWNSGKCEESPIEEPPIEEPQPSPEFPWPPGGREGNSKEVTFNCPQISVTVWFDGFRPPSGPGTRRVYLERWQHYLRKEDGSYFRTESGDLVVVNTSFKLGRKGSVNLYYHTYSGMAAPLSFIAIISVDEEVARQGYSPNNVIFWLRKLNPIPRAIAYGGGALESIDYLFGFDINDAYWRNAHKYWAVWSDDKNTCKWPNTNVSPQPRIMKDNCCDASKAGLRRLKRIEAVLQPEKFLKFDEKGNPTKVIGKIPRRLISPADSNGVVGFFKDKAIRILGTLAGFDFDASKYAPIAGYSDALGSLTMMLDRISGFWPATIEIGEENPDIPDDEKTKLQVHSISDGFKQALESIAHLVMQAQKNQPPSSEPEEDPTSRILAAILTEVGLTHKIAAITQQTTNNIEEFLDYKIRQEEEFLPMAFNPLVERTWQNLEYTKPSKAQIDKYIEKLLTPSIQDIIVTKLDDNKLLTEWMLELLKHSSAASAALTQQIKSKEDLKKAMGTARFNALVQGALNMEQIRRVLGLPSNWDMDDFADNLEDNFHPDENVDAGKHAETKPKQAKEKPRIKDISKNGRRRTR